MKKFFKIFIIVIAALIILVSAVAAYVSFELPNVGDALDIKVESTPERIERGKYLVNSVAACMVCHAQRDFNFFAGPVDSATFGAGGQKFAKEKGFPGNLYAKNITPYGLRDWTDGEIFRAITEGVSRDGTALFPLMPYQRYAQMDKEDIYSMIVYLKTLKPMKNEVPDKQLDFPLNFIVNTIPAKAMLPAKPDTSNTIEYGKYLVNAASCIQCHSKDAEKKVLKGTEFAGGQEFHMPAGIVYSPNITPDKETGIGNWTRETFIQRFKMYSDTSYDKVQLKPTDFNTPMPWITYSTMTKKDLGAIYDYLCTIKPIKNKVEIFPNNERNALVN